MIGRAAAAFGLLVSVLVGCSPSVEDQLRSCPEDDRVWERAIDEAKKDDGLEELSRLAEEIAGNCPDRWEPLWAAGESLYKHNSKADIETFERMREFWQAALDRARAVFAAGGFGATLRDSHAYMTEFTGDECFLSEHSAAILSALYGANESALACLERSFERRETAFLNLRVSSLWEPLRGDPRFEALIRRMNYPATP